MPNKILTLLKLARAHSPVAYLLVFFPACYGLFLASDNSVDFRLLFLLLIGSIIVRSAGCIINDILDRDFDRHVLRTKERPLANNSITLKEALILLVTLLLTGLAILLTLSKTAIYLGFLAFILTVLYPLMKRITHMPQIFLGFTFNMGALIAYAAARDSTSLECLVLYAACCFWTIGYDTIYGFMDIKDDKKIGVKSLAILLERKNYKLWLYCFYLSFITLFSLAFWLKKPLSALQLLLIILAAITLALQVKSLDITKPENCFARFKNSYYAGVILFIAATLSIF